MSDRRSHFPERARAFTHRDVCNALRRANRQAKTCRPWTNLREIQKASSGPGWPAPRKAG